MKILVIGDALIDKYTYAFAFRRSPESEDAWVWDVHKQKECPGGSLNVAANLASLMKEEVYFSGIVDHDRRIWLGHNYKLRDVDGLCSVTHEPLTKERLIDLEYNIQVLRIDNRKEFTEGSISDLNNQYKQNAELLTDFDCVVVSDYCKGTVSDSIIEHLQGLTCPVFVDTKRPDLSIWAGIRYCYVKINLQEYEHVINEDSVNLIVTEGPGGSRLQFKAPDHRTIHVEGQKVDDADTTGAGDAYLAGLVAGYMQHSLSIDLAMRHADLVARASVRKPGTSIVTTTDVEQELWHDYQGQARLDNG